MSTAARTRIQAAASQLEAAATSLRKARGQGAREDEAQTEFIARQRELRAARAECAFEEMSAKWPPGERISIAADLELHLSTPGLIRDDDGVAVGVDVWVSLWQNGEEIPIDPHRRIINPPTLIATGEAAARSLIEDADAAVLKAVWESIFTAPHPMGWGTRGTVTTVYASTADGHVISSSSSYSTARSGGSLGVNTYGTGAVRVGQATDFIVYECYESFLSFDTSSIPDDDVISSVVLSLNGQTDLSSSADFTVNARVKNWGSSVDTGDWVAGDSLSGLTLLATWSTTSFSSGYNDFSSQSGFASSINKSGTTYIILSSSRHEGGSTPSGAELVDFDSADTSGTSSDPKLTITHDVPPGHPYAKRLGGVPGMLHRQRPGPHIW